MTHENTSSLTLLSVCGALAAATAVVGCGGATGGMRAVGGASGSGAGGQTGGLGGMAIDAGMGGSTVVPLDCPNGVNPSAPLLTDFSATSWSNNAGKWTSAGMDLTGSKYSNGGGKTDTDAGVTTMMTNNVDTTAGNFVLTGAVAPGDYAFGLLAFDKCVNLSANTQYTGIQFTLGGNAAGCDLYFFLQTFEQQGDVNKGGCPAGNSCYNFPRKKITVPSPAAPVTVLFSDMMDTGIPTSPSAMKAEIVGLQWQFQSPPPPDGGTQPACTGISVTLDDVGFSTQ